MDELCTPRSTLVLLYIYIYIYIIRLRCYGLFLSIQSSNGQHDRLKCFSNENLIEDQILYFLRFFTIVRKSLNLIIMSDSKGVIF
jgi:hypothetical protein